MKATENLLIANVPGLGRAIPAEEAGRILNISRQGVLNAVHRGQLRGETRARILWVHLGDLRKYKAQRRRGRPPKDPARKKSALTAKIASPAKPAFSSVK